VGLGVDVGGGRIIKIVLKITTIVCATNSTGSENVFIVGEM
jgi:hypothetical protein